MHLYSLTVASSPTHTCLISQLLVVSYGSTVKIFEIDADSARTLLVCEKNLFATITRLVPVSSSSFCVLSDSGSISIIAYDDKLQNFTVKSQMYGRTGLRRTTPYIGAADPQQRLILVDAVECCRFAYVFGADLSLSGPIDCSMPDTFVYDLIAVNVGYSNPLFAQIEAPLHGERVISLYEFDLGLNMLRRRQTITSSATLLCALPEYLNGFLAFVPGAVHYFTATSTRPVLSMAMPGTAICATTLESKSTVFAQTLDGKIYKIEFFKEPTLSMALKFFSGTAPASAIHLFKSGFLYVASQRTDHAIYQINSLGEGDPVVAFSIADDTKIPEIQADAEETDNLELVDTSLSLAKTTCARLGASRTKVQTELITGTGTALRSLKFGIAIEELVSSPLDSAPLGVFVTGNPSRYIFIAFEKRLIALQVGVTVKQVEVDGLVPDTRTLWVQEIGGTLVQIHSGGIRQAFSTPIDWQATSSVVLCAANASQVLVCLLDNTLVYFEQTNGALKQVFKEKIDGVVSALALSDLPPTLLKSAYAVIGVDDTLRVFTLESKPELTSVQQLGAKPHSIFVGESQQMHVGLDNGVYMISAIVEGAVTDTKSRFMGSSGLQVLRGWVSDEPRGAVIVSCGEKSWVSLATHKFDLVQLGVPLKATAKFVTDDTPRALVGLVGTTLKIFLLENLKNRFVATDTSLASVPRQILQTPSNTYTLCPDAVYWKDKKHEFDSETAISITSCRFEARKQEFLVVGVLVNARYEHFEQKYDAAMIYTFESGDKLLLVHKTVVDGAPYALAPYKGKLLAGVGASVVVYDIGQRQLLRKKKFSIAQEKRIMTISTNRNRIFIGGSRRSLTVLAEARDELYLVADDPVSRPVSCMLVLDYDTVALGDRVGNFCVLRVPEAASALSSDEAKLLLLAAKPSNLSGAFYKLDLLANFYLGDVATSMHIGVFTPGGKEIILWIGVQGTVGALVPLGAPDYEFLAQLETELRTVPTPLDHSHLSWRGYVGPPKNVVDGDLCEDRLEGLDAETAKRVVELRARSL